MGSAAGPTTASAAVESASGVASPVAVAFFVAALRVVFVAAVFLAAVFLAAVFFAAVFFTAVFFAVAFFAAVFFVDAEVAVEPSLAGDVEASGSVAAGDSLVGAAVLVAVTLRGVDAFLVTLRAVFLAVFLATLRTAAFSLVSPLVVESFAATEALSLVFRVSCFHRRTR